MASPPNQWSAEGVVRKASGKNSLGLSTKGSTGANTASATRTVSQPTASQKNGPSRRLPFGGGGTLIVEQIYGLNGLGSLLIFGIFQRDFLVVQGAVVIICVAFVLVNFVIDLLYGFLDPRIRHARALA